MMNAHVSRYKNISLVMMCFISVDSCAINQERIIENVMIAVLSTVITAPFLHHILQPSANDVAMTQARAEIAKHNKEKHAREIAYKMALLELRAKKSDNATQKNILAIEKETREIPLALEDKKIKELNIVQNILQLQVIKQNNLLLMRDQDREQIQDYQHKLRECREENSHDHPRRCAEFEKKLNTAIGLACIHDEDFAEEAQNSNNLKFENNSIVINL